MPSKSKIDEIIRHYALPRKCHCEIRTCSRADAQSLCCIPAIRRRTDAPPCVTASDLLIKRKAYVSATRSILPRQCKEGGEQRRSRPIPSVPCPNATERGTATSVDVEKKEKWDTQRQEMKVRHTTEVEPSSESAPASRDRADKVGLVPTTTRRGGLGCTCRDLLFFDLEDGRETRGGAIGVYRGSENVTGCRTAT